MDKKALSNKTLLRMAKKLPGIRGAVIIRPADVETAAWVRLKCQFGCDGYGRCLTCPPYSPSPNETRAILDCYKRAVLLHFDSYANTKRTVAQLERAVFLSGAWKAFGFGAGPCNFCKTCPIEDRQCRHSELARPSMEACGIDVYSTVRKAGLPIEVVKTHRQCPNYYGLLLVD
jgi:predicted metal-binding protein